MARPGILTVAFLACGALAAAVQQPPAAAAQQSATTCIALVLPTLSGIPGDATDVGGSVRDLIASFLRGPSMQIVTLDARLATLAVDEAKQKSCAHVLTTALTRQSGGGSTAGAIGRVLGSAGASAAGGITGSSVASSVARSVAHETTRAVQNVAASTKARDELRLEYKLVSTAGKIEAGPKTEKAKASADGEDLLTPLVTRMAEAVVTAIKR
jgi:hypothetical protein